MRPDRRDPALWVVVGAGGVGKTTLAAALGWLAAGSGLRTLVMTFDPSRRLKDALGVGEAAEDEAVAVPGAPGDLYASLLDPRRTFDRLVARYAPDAAARDRILGNRYYEQLAGSLAGILEYMAVERLWEVQSEGLYDRIVLDTPPTRQALDFLEAPQRIVGFLDSGAVKLALKPWFDETGGLSRRTRWGRLGRPFESWLDSVVGIELLRDMAEFFRAFEPLFAGFRRRAAEVEGLLRSPETGFVLVGGAAEERVADTLFFARRLAETGHRLGPVVVNRVHPRAAQPPEPPVDPTDGAALLAWLGEQDARGLAHLRSLLGARHPLLEVPLLPAEPSERDGLARLAALVAERWQE